MKFRIPIAIHRPERVTEIHEYACVHCPSVKGTDPECEQIKQMEKSERAQTAFPCAWRHDKLCKGYCDMMGVTQSDIP